MPTEGPARVSSRCSECSPRRSQTGAERGGEGEVGGGGGEERQLQKVQYQRQHKKCQWIDERTKAAKLALRMHSRAGGMARDGVGMGEGARPRARVHADRAARHVTAVTSQSTEPALNLAIKVQHARCGRKELLIRDQSRLDEISEQRPR